MIHDGHVHTQFCPHGTKDTLNDYCEAALKLGIKGITFAEHAPLPTSFVDPTPTKDSAMDPNHLLTYIHELTELKKQYRGHLEIYTGLEVDYIDGFEKETTDFLNEVGPSLDDSILSVHFLKLDNEYICLDYSPESFETAVNLLGSIDDVHRHYYKTVQRSITANLGFYKPQRIGHITLSRKFQRKFSSDTQFTDELSTILSLLKENGYELDYNGAGCMKPLCKEPYPFDEVARQAISLGIPLVYGSDAHQTSTLLSGYDQLVNQSVLQRPSRYKTLLD